MGDVDSPLALQTFHIVASSVDGNPLCTTAQKAKAAPVSNAHEEVQIQSQRFGAGENPATPAVLVAQFDFIRSTTDDLAQFLTVEQHVLLLETPRV